MPSLVSEELLDAISNQEDITHNPNTVGDNGNAIGMFQMWPIAYKDIQDFYPEYKEIPYETLKGNAPLQRRTARQYLRLGEEKYGIKSLDGLISFYNAGPKARHKIINPGYVEGVKRHLKNPTMRRFK